MDTYPRYFSLEQADQLLEVITPLVTEMLSVRNTILKLQPKLETVLNKAVNNGGSLISGEALHAFETLKDVINKIQQYDVFVKDINSGLIDFPSIRDGEVVFLCWQYGEKQIEYWHELEDGFQGRKPV
jgi:hypothetical protein